ncbi:GntR family transcriptional regulator [Rathayibacter sp. VKM Ac-2760]|uniref:GntR family transcriptional regulator n=1 Tax=Rathayibacter sp. VKM Ac-2760 TaxID=2609253 RepID=UPI00131782CB|nr:GntR family transcriptional regulator [Rathayibacter sp. VKM Ac-2760]QHC60321.1 FCD domain-containing protein [Rathayibacter sp. VKM Ac-2760]
MTLASTEESESLASQTYRTLRREIILGHYPQGSRLVEASLATELHVSRLPVREAVPQLANEGFVRMLPRRSTRVAQWSVADVVELFDVRLSLETLAARLAAQAVAAGAPLQPLLDAIDAEHRALDSEDWLEVAETSTVVHEAIVEVAGSALLTSLMRAVTGRMTWLFYLTSARDQRQQSDEHHGLLDAIRSGNDRLAESIAFTHIEKGRAPSLAMIGGRP